MSSSSSSSSSSSIVSQLDPSAPSCGTDRTYIHPLLHQMHDEVTPTLWALPALKHLMGIEMLYMHPMLYIGRINVKHGHTQPMKRLQGGATAAFAEDLASMLSLNFCNPTSYSLGLRVTADHISSAPVGSDVYGIAIPAYLGNKMHLIDVICIVDEGDKSTSTPNKTSISTQNTSTNKSQSSKPILDAFRAYTPYTLESTLSYVSKHPHFKAFHGRQHALRVISICHVAMSVVPISLPPDVIKKGRQKTAQSNQKYIEAMAQSVGISNISYDRNQLHTIGSQITLKLRALYPDNMQRFKPLLSHEVKQMVDMSPSVLNKVYHVDEQASAQPPSSSLTTTSLDRCVSFSTLLGMEYLYLSFSCVIARMVVRSYHLQPMRLLHGGVSCALIEEVGSTAAGLYAWPHRVPVGTHLEVHHMSSARAGDILYIIAIPQHMGKKTHVWDVTIIKESEPQPKKHDQGMINIPQTSEDEQIQRLMHQQHPSSSIPRPSHTLDQLYNLIHTSGITPLPNKKYMHITVRGMLASQLQPYIFPGDIQRVANDMMTKARTQLKSTL